MKDGTKQAVRQSTDQPDGDEEELDDVGVGHGVEPAQEGVEDGHGCRHDDGQLRVDVQDHCHCVAWCQHNSVGL